MSGSGLSNERLGRMHEVLGRHVESGAMPGLVAAVSRRGEVHCGAIGTMDVGGDRPMSTDSIFRLASLTKPIVAAAAMVLVEECVLRLDHRVDDLLPELADRRVLRRLDGPVEDTVPAKRAITLRDLLTFRLGMGPVMAAPGAYPIQKVLEDSGCMPSPFPASLTPDEWMASLGTLPLLHQPGEGWMYHVGSDVLGVLIARATGQSLEGFLRERIFEPLGMVDTGFHVPAEKLHRLPTLYGNGDEPGTLAVADDPNGSQWSSPPAFPSGGGGLVSTAHDYLVFCQMLLDQGRYDGGRVLSRPSVQVMTTDQLTAEQRASAPVFLGDDHGWGFGVSVALRRTGVSVSPGRFGWAGGTGTSGYTDPSEELIGVLLTQRLVGSPEPELVFDDFWTLAYQAIDD